MILRIGAIVGESSLSTFGRIASGPAALCGFRFFSSLIMPLVLMKISGISG